MLRPRFSLRTLFVLVTIVYSTMNYRKPDRLDFIASFVAAGISAITFLVARQFVPQKHTILLIISCSILMFVLATCTDWLMRKG